jgi:plastocyanin
MSLHLALTGLLVGVALAATPALSAEYTIVLNHLKFGPIPAELHVGDTIIWENDDLFRHSATARDKSFDVDLPPGTRVPLVLAAAGSVDFFCKFHPGMTGTLVISP